MPKPAHQITYNVDRLKQIAWPSAGSEKITCIDLFSCLRYLLLPLPLTFVYNLEILNDFIFWADIWLPNVDVQLPDIHVPYVAYLMTILMHKSLVIDYAANLFKTLNHK